MRWREREKVDINEQGIYIHTKKKKEMLETNIYIYNIMYCYIYNIVSLTTTLVSLVQP